MKTPIHIDTPLSQCGSGIMAADGDTDSDGDGYGGGYCWGDGDGDGGGMGGSLGDGDGDGDGGLYEGSIWSNRPTATLIKFYRSTI